MKERRGRRGEKRAGAASHHGRAPDRGGVKQEAVRLVMRVTQTRHARPHTLSELAVALALDDVAPGRPAQPGTQQWLERPGLGPRGHSGARVS